MKSRSLMVIPALAIAACTNYVGPQSLASLGETPALGGGSFSSGGGVTIAADIREKNGQTLLCGVWAQSREQSILTKGRASSVLPKARVELNGKQIAQGLSFMSEVAPAADYGGSTANCRLIDRPWQSGDETRELSIDVSRHIVYRELDDVGGGVIVSFRPDGPGAGGF